MHHSSLGDQFDHSEKTANKLATEYNVGSATIRRDAKRAQAIDSLPEPVKTLCRDDAEALILIDDVVNKKQGQRTDLLYNVQEVNEEAPTGNTKQAAIRKLKKHAPELLEQVKSGLHKEVLSGAKTVHQAISRLSRHILD